MVSSDGKNMESDSSPAEQDVLYEPPQAMSDELIMRMVSGSDITMEIRSYLQGKVYDPQNGEYVLPKGATPLMNDKGINDIMNLLQQVINRNTIMSCLDDEIICNITEEIGMDINGLLVVNMDKYEIQEEMWTLISKNVTDAVYFALRRARVSDKGVLGATLLFFKTTYSNVRHETTPVGEKEKRGILPGFSIFRK